MGPGRKMELPYRRYSVPETVMRKYWMTKEKANSKSMVDKCSQTELRPCVIWTEASNYGSRGRSASEPWLQSKEGVKSRKSRPSSDPSTPSWSSTTLPPPTTSAHTSSTSTSLPTTDPTRSPRPAPSVQVLCFHHGVSKADVILQYPEPSESSPSDDFPCHVDIGVNTEDISTIEATIEEGSQDVAIQTGSPIFSEDSLSNNKLCQTDFASSLPSTNMNQTKKSDSSCQTSKHVGIQDVKTESNEFGQMKSDSIETTSNSDASYGFKKAEASIVAGNYNQFPVTDVIIPRYSAVPRTGSMVVNMSSLDNISDSDLSLTDSLDDPCEGIINQWSKNKLDNRLVRGEVSQPVFDQKSYINSKNTYAYFLFLSGEEGSIKQYRVPDKLEARLRRKEEEIKKVFGLRYKNEPKIAYMKRRKHFPIVVKETESQTNISKIAQTGSSKHQAHKIFGSKSLDSNCECSTSRKGEERKISKSKTVSNFDYLNSDTKSSEDFMVSKQSASSKSTSSEEKTPRISLTLVVPSRSKRKDEETLDEKVAKVLIESLEDIRSQKHTIQANIEAPEKPSEMSQYFKKKAQALAKSEAGVPRYHSNSILCNAHIDKRLEDEKKQRNNKPEHSRHGADGMMSHRSNIKYDEIQSKSSMTDSIGNKALLQENCSENIQPQSSQKISRDQWNDDRSARYLNEIIGESSKINEQYSVNKTKSQVQDEDLLRAVLKESIQQNLASSSKTNWNEINKIKNGHSEVCELGLKFLSNEIDIDHFLAGIPLERIEKDVKRLMYKHYLGCHPPAKEENSAYENLMKKKMVVSFVDKDNGEVEVKETNRKREYCVHCRSYIPEEILSESDEVKKKRNTSQHDSMDRSEEVYCNYCHQYFTVDSQKLYEPKEEPKKSEKGSSPLDKSIATAMQTTESFLDSERLPPEVTLNSQNDIMLLRARDPDDCKLFEESCGFVNSSHCLCCKHDSMKIQKNVNVPNNHLVNHCCAHSTKPTIKNNLELKNNRCSDMTNNFDTKKPSTKDANKETKNVVAKVQTTKKTKNAINIASKDQVTLSKEPLEVKVVDNKGNILSHGSKNIFDKYEKKTSKTTNKKSQNPGTKYTQLFDAIPEEKCTPRYTENYETRQLEACKKNRNAAPIGQSKQHSCKGQSRSYCAGHEHSQYYGTPKKLVNKSVETVSHKSVSTMVNFEQKMRDDVEKDKHYQLKSKSFVGKMEKDIFFDGMKQEGNVRKAAIVGKYRPLQEKSSQDDETAVKKKHDRSGNKKKSDDMMSLSKGWINFYLVRDNDNLTDSADKDNVRTLVGEIEEDSHASNRKCIQKTSKTKDKQVQLPSLVCKETRKGYRSSSDCSNVSLPDIKSSSSSAPSSPENRQRSQTFRKPVDLLPELGNDGNNKKKKTHQYYNTGEKKMVSGITRTGERSSHRVDISRSEYSMSSVTSSTVVMSESSGAEEGIRGQNRKNRKSKPITTAPIQSDSGSCWTVTVAGSGGAANQVPPEVEMRLSFAGLRNDASPNPQVVYSTHKATNLAIKSSKQHEIVEENPDSARSDNSQCSSGEQLSCASVSKRMGSNQHTRMYMAHDDCRRHAHGCESTHGCHHNTRKCASDDECERDNRKSGLLHVTGSAITPEEKPRVPTQSERDLVRAHRYRFTR